MEFAVHDDDRAGGAQADLEGDPPPDRHLRRGRIVARLSWFLLLSVVTAALAVATPVLAGQVVDAIVGGSKPSVVVRIAVLIAVIAVLEAGLGLLTRWFSASIGEGLILDLRRAVFDHVQRMPIAFFTRTRTGALVSRLNNDVIGAQRAFSDTLLRRRRQPGDAGADAGGDDRHLLADHPARPAAAAGLRAARPSDGDELARLEREAANLNSAMSTQMTERFSAPGATLVKLFGRPARESAEFAASADRVRDIGVKPQWCSGCSSPR